MNRRIQFSKSSSQDSEENVLPLINIVFLLLIFFLWAGTLSMPDLFYVRPPESINENPDVATESILLISHDNRYAFRNQHVKFNDVASLVRQSIQQYPEQTVKIKVDADINTGKLIDIMEILRDEGVKKTVLVTEQTN